MDADRWQQLKKLFEAALEKAPSERLSFITRACGGDANLRKELESLLKMHDDSFLEKPAFEAVPELLESQPTDSFIGKRLGSYVVVEKLGSGGMGVVYKAEDSRLGRFVALKFLPDSATTDPLLVERFRREARAASALSHPNICTIHDIDECEGQTFIAMELLEGQTLRQRIAEQALLPSDEMLDLSIQIADALNAAHTKGIVHRDIKPANIFITQGAYKA